MSNHSIHIQIHSYQRKDMLEALIKEIKAFSSSGNQITYSIIDDGSDYKLDDPNFIQIQHGGKEFFWKLWNVSLNYVKPIEADIYLFIPSDYSNVNFDEIIRRHITFGHLHYAYNVINDGRTNCWNLRKPISVERDSMQVGFTDCGFFCNKETLISLNYNIKEINPRRFLNQWGPASSGVGQQMTQRMNQIGIKMYLPNHSLAYHGNHESIMHKEHRIEVPLISK